MQDKANIAINGFGRIGRSVFRALLERPALAAQLNVVAINELADAVTLTHLFKYDSTHGRLKAAARCDDERLFVDAGGLHFDVALSHQHAVADLDLSHVDLLLECSGQLGSPEGAQACLGTGAAKLLYSSPAFSDVDATIVYGVNHDQIRQSQRVVSNASCTTNAVVPVIQLLDEAFGIESGAITTLHSAMNDQPVIDAYHHTDLRKTRAAIGSMIPVTTGLAQGIGRLLPSLSNAFTAHAIRVPTMNVSAIDLTVQLQRPVDVDAVNALLREASVGDLAGVMLVTDEKLASCDFNHDPHSVIVDASQTQVANGRLVKLLLWFDNEWGYANRMLDVAALMLGLKAEAGMTHE